MTQLPPLGSSSGFLARMAGNANPSSPNPVPPATAPQTDPNSPRTALSEYEAETERLREKVALSDDVSFFDAFRLKKRSEGTADRRTLSRPEGGTILGKGLG